MTYSVTLKNIDNGIIHSFVFKGKEEDIRKCASKVAEKVKFMRIVITYELMD